MSGSYVAPLGKYVGEPLGGGPIVLIGIGRQSAQVALLRLRKGQLVGSELVAGVRAGGQAGLLSPGGE